MLNPFYNGHSYFVYSKYTDVGHYGLVSYFKEHSYFYARQYLRGINDIIIKYLQLLHSVFNVVSLSREIAEA